MSARLVALVPVLGLLLSGCTGGGAAQEPDPTIAPLPSPTATAPTSTAAEVPAAAQEDSRSGAVAFVRHYYETLRTSLLAGDAAALEALSSPTCKACRAMVDVIEAEAAAGRRYAGGEITDYLAEGVQDAPGRVGVVVRYSSRPYTLTATGAAPTPVPGAQDANIEASVERAGDSWRIAEITVVEVR